MLASMPAVRGVCKLIACRCCKQFARQGRPLHSFSFQHLAHEHDCAISNQGELPCKALVETWAQSSCWQIEVQASDKRPSGSLLLHRRKFYQMKVQCRCCTVPRPRGWYMQPPFSKSPNFNSQPTAPSSVCHSCCGHAFSEAGSSVGHEVMCDEGCHPEGWKGLQGHH